MLLVLALSYSKRREIVVIDRQTDGAYILVSLTHIYVKTWKIEENRYENEDAVNKSLNDAIS